MLRLTLSNNELLNLIKDTNGEARFKLYLTEDRE